jgi:cob(I)alamin adenosyltransferase
MWRRKTLVRITKVYTKTGDSGITRLGDNTKALKTDLRIEAYADVDEANSAIGVAIALGELKKESVKILLKIQNDLFDVGADVATPLDSNVSQLRVTPEYILWLENNIDTINSSLPPLNSFILPGGSKGSSLLHMARTVTRRAERSVWTALEKHKICMTDLPPKYLNRLSDLLFVMSRQENPDEVLWIPGRDR